MNAPTAAIAAPTVTSSPLPISREIWHAGHPIFDINGSAIVVPRPRRARPLCTEQPMVPEDRLMQACLEIGKFGVGRINQYVIVEPSNHARHD